MKKGGNAGPRCFSWCLRDRQRQKDEFCELETSPKSGPRAHTSGTPLLVDVLERLGRLRFLLLLFNLGAVGRDGLDQLLLFLAGVLHDDDATCVELATDTAVFTVPVTNTTPP